MNAKDTVAFGESLRSDILIENIASIAQSEPERMFTTLVFREQPPLEIAYGGLLTHAGQYAALYEEKGLPRDSVVVIILNHGPEILYAFVGALLYGAVPSIFAQPSVKIGRD